MKPWGYQAVLKDKGIVPSIGDIRQRIISIKNPRDRFFITVTYLTAGRVQEVLSLKPENITRAIRNDREVLLFDYMKNEKNKKRPTKSIPIPLEREPELCDVVLTYIEALEARSDGEIGVKNTGLFGFKTARHGWYIMKQYGVNPHWLRHIRLTHLVTVYDFSDQLLVRWAGWTDSKPAKHYIELKWFDFLDKM